MGDPYLIPSIAKGPAIVRRITGLIPPMRLDERVDPDRFSAREALAHLADGETILRARLLKTLNEPGCTIEPYDEGKRAEEMGYSRWDPDATVQQFADERAKTVEVLQGLAPEDWSKSGTHLERGVQTLAEQARIILGHDTYHIEHLMRYCVDCATPDFVAKQATEVIARDKPVYAEYLRVPSMSVGIYVLPAGSADPQKPHVQDELYYVLSGQGSFSFENQVVPVSPGSSLFVAAGREHRFRDITEDLTVLVVFAGASE